MISSSFGTDGLRDCFRDPIPEIFEAANLLKYAVLAHLRGDKTRAETLLQAADMPILGDWLDPIWIGVEANKVYQIDDLPPILLKPDRHKPRDAPLQMKKALVLRDGHHCRLCGIPLVRPEIRKFLNKLYPEAARWTGARATEQHRGLQVLWLQYDHVVVHSRGGQTDLDNLVVTCAACNFGRDRFMMAEVGIRDPRSHPRAPSWDGWKSWDGLEEVLPAATRYLAKPKD